MENELISLIGLARELNLPPAWLKAEASAGRLPHLRVGKRLRFNREPVARALAERAGREGVANGK